MKEIKLNKGKLVIVDDDLYDYLNQWRWFISWNGYAIRKQHIRNGIRKYIAKPIYMHRLINKTPTNLFTDHINRNKLDNRKSNLRTVNKSANSINRGISQNNKSGFKGVYWDKFNDKWRAEIKINYKKISLGRFTNIEDALIARRKGEEVYHAI